ncbi:hypothetical protein B0H14DRAFT_2335511, partial [Mycena olivaceomarginata]
VFRGKLNYELYATNENLFVTLPDGLSSNAHVSVNWTWTTDASGVEKSPGSSLL